MVRAQSLYLWGSWFESRRADKQTCYDARMPREPHPAFNAFMQIGLIGFTMSGFLLTGLKYPQYGLLANLTAQIFWFYTSYRAWKEADQFGIFLTTIFVTVILAFGVANYWFF